MDARIEYIHIMLLSYSATCTFLNTLKREKTMNFDKELNARGLSCPLPIVKTKKSLSDMTSGQVLKVISTDTGSVKDMAAFAEQTGNPLLGQEEVNGEFVFYMKKK
jgi:tRNA 2-thiouridine synthesizing protein A